MDEQLRLHPENLALFLEPTFKRQTIGFYSVDKNQQYHNNDSEKAGLVALKEKERIGDGVTEYEVPQHLDDRDLSKGYELYSDVYDNPEQDHLIQWLQDNKDKCEDVDVVCTHQIIAKVYKAPYVEPSSLPWEIRVRRGPDGVCYLREEENLRHKYSEMNAVGKKQVFRQRSLKRCMTVKKSDRVLLNPPGNRGAAFYRVNKVQLDAGVLVYQSEAQCFDINSNTIDFKVQRDTQYDLPAPSVRLNWWVNGFLAGSESIMSGYYVDEEDNSLSRLMSFNLHQLKPSKVLEVTVDDEICTASLCTFIQFVKDLMANGRIASCILRFEPGSKRLCVLDMVSGRPPKLTIPGFGTQVSATDETSSVEVTPRTPDGDTDSLKDLMMDSSDRGVSNGIPRLRRKPVDDSVTLKLSSRRDSLTTEAGNQQSQEHDNDDDKYGPKKQVRKRRAARDDGDEEEMNWFHVGIIFVFIAIGLIFVPVFLDWLDAKH